MKIKDLFKCFDFDRFNENDNWNVINIYSKEESGAYTCTEAISSLDELIEFLESNSEVEVANWYFDYCSYMSDYAVLEIYCI